MKTYIFHSDPGHGWLAVKRKECEELGILDKISSCSYVSDSGKTIYLEEDCDAPLFLSAKRERNEEFEIRESFKVHTHVRNLNQFI